MLDRYSFAFRCLIFFFLLGLSSGHTLHANQAGTQQRPFTPDDLMLLEEIGEVALSPDGQWLAYVIKRPIATAPAPLQSASMEGDDRGDIWLVSLPLGKPRNLTNGAASGAGYWSPIWSPDGQRLAMLSTKGGNARAWVWERSSGRMKQLSERGVDLSFMDVPLVWISNQQLAYVALPEGQKPLAMTMETQAMETAMREWPKAWKGQQTTASVLESGITAPMESRPQSDLLLIDLEKGSQPLITAPTFRDLSLSPNKQQIAMLKQVDIVRVDPARSFSLRISTIFQAVVVSLQGAPLFPGLKEVTDVRISSIRWSLDGTALALMNQPTTATPETQLMVCLPGDGGCRPAMGEDLTVMFYTWAKKNTLLALAMPKAEAEGAQISRPDWWAIEANGARRNLTAQMKSAPEQLWGEADGESFIGVADGDLWRIRLNRSEAQNLTAGFEPIIDSMVWPPSWSEDRTGGMGMMQVTNDAEVGGVRQVILGARKDGMLDLYYHDLSSGRTSALEKPSPKATLVGFAHQHGTAVFTANEKTGTYLWVSRPGFKEFTSVVETNTFLREIAQGEVKKIEYRSLEGQALSGWVILPVGYQEGTRYPLITWVYLGEVMRESIPSLARIDGNISLNLQLLAARGYAVLLPSMPTRSVEGETGDPYMELTNGVMPAVEKVIALGIADPNNLGVMGQSFGGYSVYGLITQTKRFRAAVALAGISDLTSLYGQLDARFRYDPFRHEHMDEMVLTESGQSRMGNPPWKDYGRYLRNSPLFYVERVETPLLIVQGDMDFVPIQQGEQFFTALYRQNKRARFVRYWGEGHTVEGPANVRDMWQQIYGWFDEFLRLKAKR